MQRRDFLAQSLLAAAGTTAAVAIGPGATPVTRRPNILWVMTDQQYGGVMGCEGWPGVATPAMDSLARSGIRFRKAYSSNPICVPSRTSMMTGLMGHQTGVEFNLNYDEEKGSAVAGTSVACRLKGAGYDTAYFGKWHIPHPLNDVAWSGFDTQVEPAKGPLDPVLLAPAAAFLKAPHTRPFFMVVSYLNPHDICEFARILAGQDEKLKQGPLPALPPELQLPPLPPNFSIPADEPEAIRVAQSYPKMASAYPTKGFGDLEWRQYRWGYNRLTEMVDTEVGRLMLALRESGQEQDTVVIFTSDHGDGLGAHHWNQKSLLYEEVARVPFILSRPGTVVNNIDSETLVNTGTDIATTILGLAGVERPSGLSGVDLSVSLSGGTPLRREYVVSQTNLTLAYGVRGPYSARMVRSARYKYIAFDGGANPEQLFDLEKDPGEMMSLVKTAAARSILEQHRAYLRQWLRESGDGFKAPA